MLGLRFRVMILFPAIAMILTFEAVIGAARGDQFWSVVVAMILRVAAVEVGYLVGVFIRTRGRSFAGRQQEHRGSNANERE